MNHFYHALVAFLMHGQFVSNVSIIKDKSLS